MTARHVPNARGEDGVSRPITSDAPIIPAYGGLGPNLGGGYQCRGNSLQIGTPGDPVTGYNFEFTRIGRPSGGGPTP
jgi:hypothetical protein